MLYLCVKQEAAPLEYVALVLSRLAQHNGIPGSLEYVGLILGRPDRNTSRAKMRGLTRCQTRRYSAPSCSENEEWLLMKRSARGRVTVKNTPKTMIRGRSLARTASQSVLMRNTATAWYGGAAGLGRGKQNRTHWNIKQKPESKILTTKRKTHKART
jgi:hypothetical protein